MSKYFVVALMIFCHIVDDYYFQSGILSLLKQKQWWKDNAPDELYKYDYLVGLVMHGYSWSFMIMLPIAIFFSFDISFDFCIIMVINSAIHSVVDDAKANRKRINLIFDQLVHMLQIIVTAIILL